jgi:hypothetical protein
MGGHSSRRRIAPPLKQPTRATGPDEAHMPPLFGLAPGGVYRAGPVAGPAVGSYPTLSPLPSCAFGFGGLARSSLKRRRAVCFLWHFPWGRPRRGLPGTVVPWSPDFPRPARCASRGRPTFWPFLSRGSAASNQERRGDFSGRQAHRQSKPTQSSPRGRGRSKASNIARHSPSIVPSISSGRKRRWNATVAASGSLTS